MSYPEPQRNLNILIVDDNPDVADLTAIHLKNVKNNVLIAHSGDAALEAFCSVTADIVLMDIVMPGMSGLETCRLMRQLPNGDEAIIIAHTAWDTKSDRQRAIESGFDHFLVKPVNAKLLNDLIEHVRDFQ